VVYVCRYMATRIYTKTGDDGTTGLFGGERVKKYSQRIEAYGTVDELNSVIGLTLTTELTAEVTDQLTKISSLLFNLGSDLATPLQPPPSYPIPRITDQQIELLEQWIDAHEATLEPLKQFILPGGTDGAAYLHLARTVCRRAERRVVELGEQVDLGLCVVKFLNRLSDYLFVLARRVNADHGVKDVPWLSL